MKNLLPGLFALLLLFACAPQGAALEQAQIVLHTRSGAHAVRIEIADDDASRRKGLQHRTQLDPDQGMLFDFQEERLVSFWMKDTPLPLDMMFFDARGKLRAIVSNTTPYSEKPIRPAPRVQYVLEMLAGSAERLEMQPGDMMSLPGK